MTPLTDPSARDAEGLAEIFRYFGEVETPRLGSPVYTAYSLGVAEDADMLALAAHVDPGQPAPNVFYAAVKDCLLEDAESSHEASRLARFYPSISGQPIPDESPWSAFRAFCLAHAEVLLPRLRKGRTQTCVVHRCTVILPALASLPRVAAADGRVALLEIGPSAGLNLRLDRYRYVYRDTSGRERSWGAREATPVLECEARGETAPPLPERLDVVARRGLELNPLDPEDPATLRWLRALIWPEHALRGELMEQALAHTATTPVEVEQGDATRDLEACVLALPVDAPRVLFATHVLYQIPEAGRKALVDGVARASLEAPVDLLIMDSTGEGDSRIEWLAFDGGERLHRRTLALADSHGRWIEWGAVGR